MPQGIRHTSTMRDAEQIPEQNEISPKEETHRKSHERRLPDNRHGEKLSGIALIPFRSSQGACDLAQLAIMTLDMKLAEHTI